MYRISRLFINTILLIACFCATPALAADDSTTANVNTTVPILLYHRFGPTAVDSMTITTESFAAQLKWLKDNQYTVIPLKTLVDYLINNGPTPPAKSVVIVADDGHKSVYSDMWPLIRQYNIPVTLFLYPSAISNASYAMTWQQLEELQKTGLFDMQGHTYWHPNFNHEKKKLSPEEYQKFVMTQLNKSKTVIDKKLNANVDLLAWPFGIYNDELEQFAKDAGYVMAFSIDARNASKSENPMSEPRYMIVNGNSNIKAFETIVMGQAQKKGHITQ